MSQVDHLPGYNVNRTTVVNCEPPATPGTGGGGGGGTSPIPPGGYNPCDGSGGRSSIKFEPGTRLAIIAVAPCDEGYEPTPVQVTPSQYLIKLVPLTEPAAQIFVNDPANEGKLGPLIAYLESHNNDAESKEFVKWAIGFLELNTDIEIALRYILIPQKVLSSLTNLKLKNHLVH